MSGGKAYRGRSSLLTYSAAVLFLLAASYLPVLVGNTGGQTFLLSFSFHFTVRDLFCVGVQKKKKSIKELLSHFSLFRPSRPWTASSLWWTWRVTSCSCRRMWPSTCATTRRSWWTPVSTACCMSGIMLSSSRTCCPNPLVSLELIFPVSTCFALWLFFYLSLSVSLCHLCSMSLSLSLSLFSPSPHVCPLCCITPASAHNLAGTGLLSGLIFCFLHSVILLSLNTLTSLLLPAQTGTL